jgi:hypothetical protein
MYSIFSYSCEAVPLAGSEHATAFHQKPESKMPHKSLSTAFLEMTCSAAVASCDQLRGSSPADRIAFLVYGECPLIAVSSSVFCVTDLRYE